MIEFKVKMTLQEYRKLNFLLVYKRPMTIFLTFIGIINIIAFVMYLLGNTSSFLTNPIFNLIFGLAITLMTPLSIFYSTKKSYEINKYMQSETEWTITQEKIKIKGKSFEGEYDWTNIYKIIKVGNCIIIYKDRIIGNFIPINSFNSKEDYQLFWEYAKQNNVTVK